MTIKVGQNFFSGAAQVHGKNGLAGIVRAMAQDVARAALVTLNPADLTDNTTGTNNVAGFVELVLPSRFNAASAGGVTPASLNTAIGKINDAHKNLINSMAPIRVKLGLDPVTQAAGGAGTANTLIALDKTVTTASGAASADFGSALETLKTVRDNHRKIIAAFNEVMVAVGQPKLITPFKGPMKLSDALPTPATVTTGTGNPSISKVQTDAFLLALTNNLATLANRWNAAFPLATNRPVAIVAV